MIEFLAFVSGAILMALEILGSRVLAPQYGNSVVVWGSLIGVFMGALAAGYWLGGMLADRWPRRTGLAGVLALSAVLVAAVPLMAPYVFAVAGDGPRSGSLAAAAALFFLPTMLMGTVSPYAIRLKEFGEGHLGRTAGRLYAISTAGSIAGTITTAFWLIPLAGVTTLISSLGVALMLLASIAFLWKQGSTTARRLGVAAAVAAAVMVLGAYGVRLSVFGSSAEGARILVDRDSLYHHIRVLENDGIRVLKFDRGTQSAMRVSDPLAGVFAYTDALHLPMALRPDVRDVLLIGVGGATIPKQFLAAYPSVRMDAVEIDGDVIDVARKHFALTDSPRLRIHVNDGRKFLSGSEQQYDLIELDAFHADSMPFHLFTKEFFTLCRQHLRPAGMVAINLIGSVDGEGSAVVASVYQTVGAVFPERYVFVMNSREQRERTVRHNVILIAGDRAQMSEQELRNAVFASKLAGPYARRIGDYTNRAPDSRYGRVLSDDFAPTDDLLMLAGGTAHFQSDSSRGARK